LHSSTSRVLRSHHFNSAEDLEKTLHRFVWLYNHHLPQKALGHEAPVQALKKWKMKAPDLFVKNVRNHPGPDSYELGIHKPDLLTVRKLAAVLRVPVAFFYADTDDEIAELLLRYGRADKEMRQQIQKTLAHLAVS
jgi:hypothetical protein